MEKKRDSSDSSTPASEFNTEENGAVPSKKHEVLIRFYLHPLLDTLPFYHPFNNRLEGYLN